MQVGWISDIHLDFLDGNELKGFIGVLETCGVDAWLLTGDIGQANSVGGFLRMLESALLGKIYFVLGNHDYYGAGISRVRQQVGAVAASSHRLIWLTQMDPQQLPGGAAIVGDDGWADARLGSPYITPVELTDFFAIEDFRGLARQELVMQLRALGDKAASRLGPKLVQAAAANRRVLVLTHVPPFWEAAWHEGQLANKDWVPWFTCSAIGKVLMDAAIEYPSVVFDVLCGHTHSASQYSPVQNLTVYTAGAEYGAPSVQKVVDLAVHG